LIYVVLKRDLLTDFHWVYLLDEQFRVNRVSEQKNVSPHMVPPGRTILCIELSLWKDEPLWEASDEEIYRLSLRDLMQMGYGITESEVEQYFVTDIPTAYPVYELNFEDHLIPVLEGVHALENLLTLGRHGLFLNNSMDDNVLLGMRVADHLEAHNGADSKRWLSDMLAFMNLRFQGK
jgi:protoporphyrinogen oxidase